MTLDPRTIHQLDQSSALIHELGGRLKELRRELLAAGFTEEDVSGVVRAMESAILEPILDDAVDLTPEG